MSENEAKLRDYLKRTTADLRRARRSLSEVEANAREPIAIVGMGCRYPGGASGPGKLWELLATGGEGIVEFPGDRGWDLERLYDPNPDRPQTSHAREGGFLSDAVEFDAEFFGIGSREARAMDPQQRLFLETCWEAVEDAGIDLLSLRGKSTGVFAGISSQDYTVRDRLEAQELEGYLTTGAVVSVVSGRVAYALGLEGPAITVDTACSSSLVSLHLASRALRAKECSLALAGGVTIIATPTGFTEMSRLRGLAPDGRCKSFADSADGVGWGEGVGVLLLSRLSEAERQGHPILAVLRGSAVNQDGASNGLTAPNGPSQERVIRQALANARLTPKDIDAVEAHGTGTTLGDPIEAGALLATYGQDREQPLRLGSIKSNIGHTQAAAGAAGVIKMVLAMREGLLPKSLHIDSPSSKVDWEAGEIELLREPVPWQPNGKPRRAAVSSFGISGTNAHVILEEAPAPSAEKTDGGEAPVKPLPTQIPLPLSAKTEPALREAASRLASHLKASPELEPVDVAYSLASGRSLFEHRGVAFGEERKEILAALDCLAAGTPSPNAVGGVARAPQRPVFLFPGQGSQAVGMARELFESSPSFKTQMQACEQALSPFVEWSLQEVIADTEGRWLDRLDIVQPALFAAMVSLAALWRECGVEPSAVVGHSQGEIAAAHFIGALSLDDAARIVALRAQAMAKIAGKGAMLSVSLPVSELEALLAPFEDRVSLAALNGPASQVLSGEPQALEDLEAICGEREIRAQKIAVDYAAHSAQVEDLREELLEAFAPISPQGTEIPFHSTLEGKQVDTAGLGPEYWYRNLRETVLLQPVLYSLLAQGQRTFIEVSPHPVLSFAVQETIDRAPEGEEAAVLGTLRRDEGGPGRFARSLAEAHTAGASIDWSAFFQGTGAKRVPLPTYPFQRKRYWLEGSANGGDPTAIGQIDAEHPLLGAAIESPDSESLTLTGQISLSTHPWLGDHAIAGNVLLPGTAFLELALNAAERLGASQVGELTLQAPLIFSERGSVAIQLTVSEPEERGDRQIAIYSRAQGTEEEEESEWQTHATGTLSSEPTEEPEPLDAWPPEGAEQLETADLYERLAEAGLEYGPAFQGLTRAWRDGEEIYAEVTLAEEQSAEAERYGVHPALLDSALHGIGLAASEGESPKLPFSWQGVCLHARGAGELRVRLAPQGEDGISLLLADGEGSPVAKVDSLATRPLSPEQLQGARQAKQGLLGIEWQELSLPEEAETETPEVTIHRPEPDPDADPPAAARQATEKTLAAVQEWLGSEHPEDSRFALLTEGAIAVKEGESPELAQATLWGLVRSAQSEHPGSFVLVDTDGTDASEAAISSALASAEPQVALREGVASAPKALPLASSPERLIPPTGPWRLDALQRGTLESLALVPSQEEPLGPTGVRVGMHAAGLNFRDVLIALGLYPGQAPIGSEGAGVVLEVGEEVEDLSPGDKVMGLLADAFAPSAITDRALLVPIPEGWSFEQAAAIPTVFCTAYYGLLDLASLKKGEKVLIHAGAGGVGMAAIGIARHLGAEVYATASESKWETLQALGLAKERIASSRDLEFAERFQDQEIDVVLNSLAGEFVDASLGLLSEGGRFMEMGKTDVRDPKEIQAQHPGVSYRAFDTIEAGQERLGEILAELTVLLSQGSLSHSPVSTWDVREAPAAFRHLREGQNVGKVVLSLPRPIDPDRTVLITGGTGTLGSLLARHLVKEHGARHLLLTSRSGTKAEGAKELQAELGELGAKAKIATCDVADKAQVKELLASIPGSRPLGAVIHAAGALDDGTIDSMSPERIERVFAPKAEGAWNLHELTADTELSAFLCFSSIAATLGGPGQSNYAAANAFCDGLASQRKAEGLPASSIAWGVWETESEMTAGLSDADRGRMERSGIAALADAEGLALFDAALAAGTEQAIAMRLIPAGLRAQAKLGALHPLLRGLVRVSGARSAGAGSLARKLAAVSEAEREAVALELVRAEVATVLGHQGIEAIEPQRSFKDLGFDSLAAVELRNRLSTLSGLRLAATVVFDYPTSARLADHLLAQATASGATVRAVKRRSATEEPIAILGMACRYPGGVSDPGELWALLSQGRDGIVELPSDRGWDTERLYHPDPEHPGTSYSRQGGFLAEVADFDAEFFGIGPREALAIDPQQRLLLEGCWEALEDAGIDPASLAGSQTGVFAGVMSSDYASHLGGRIPAEIEGYLVTGTSGSVASGRVAYSLGLEGPAMTVDTACSSSLVALHQAIGALRGGECDLALAGGVTVLSTPGALIEFSRQRGLAPDGRCKSFAEGADGTGFAEGVGVLLLSRLSEAERQGHPILAVLRGSAVNQDGASNGLTAPNGPSQERVIRQALANARLTPKDIDAVEAHGTGTTLGDPIEAGALLATYGQDREQPLRLGSIKSNIGHTQAAAGAAGVIKMVLAMREGLLPKSLHIDSPSSKVDWEAGEIELLREPVPWQPNGKPRRAAVSSFGISGTNAHVILEEAPKPSAEKTDGGEAPVKPLPAQIPLPLSAKTEPALREAASRLASHLKANPELEPADVAYSLASGRSLFEHRGVAFGEERKEILAALDCLAQGKESPHAVSAKATPGKLAYLFSGQGAQRAEMGKALYETHPLFREALDEACAQIDPHLDRPLEDLLFASKGTEQAELLDRTQYTQPALFAVELALYRQLQSQGLKPDLLAGHSIGEIAAAHIAGVFDLADAAKLICARGALMGELPEGGAMVAVEATEAEAVALLAGKELAIAAINGPASVVLSGKTEEIDTAQAHFDSKGKKTKRLSVSHAFHSPLIEPMLDDFAKLASALDYREPQIPIVSNRSGELLDPAQAQDPAYWVSQARDAVRFADSVSTLAKLGATVFVEIGPDPVLSAMAAQTLEAEERSAATIPTLREGREEAEALSGALARAHTAGASIDWSAFFQGTGAKRVPLPTYPFQRKRYWLEGSSGAGDVGAAGLRDAEHPLLGAAVEPAEGEGLLLTGRLSLQTHPWLKDHAVAGNVLLPGTAFLELALNAAERLGASQVRELTLQAPLILPERGALQIQLAAGEPNEEAEREISIHSRPESGAEEEAGEWSCHARGVLSSEEPDPDPRLQELGDASWPPEGAEAMDLTGFYAQLVEAGLEYGPAFQGLTAAWRNGERLYAEVALDRAQGEEAERYSIHPALLDAALHGAALLTGPPDSTDPTAPGLPFSWSDVALHHGAPSQLRVRIQVEEREISLAIADGSGMPVATVGSLATRPLSPEQLAGAGPGQRDLYAIEWVEAPLGSEEDEDPATTIWRLPADETPGDLPGAALAVTEQALEAVKEWLAKERSETSRLALITQGAVSPRGESPDLAQASLWGLLRSAQSEHPDCFCLIDVDGSEESERAIGAALATGEPQLALRTGEAFAPRLARAGEGKAGPAADSLDPERTILITGGTGGLGALIARHLVSRHGARHLLLASRSGEEAEGAKELWEELEELGAEVKIVPCDVSEREQVEALLAEVPEEHSLGAIIHAAGTLDDGLVETMDSERIERVFSPKARAAWHLHELSAELDLTAFVSFSSAAATLGGPGQSNYAAANAFLDGLAARREAEGRPATSIAWGVWAMGAGMASRLSDGDLMRMERSGVRALSGEEGLALFDAALLAERPLVLPIGLAPATLRVQASVGVLPPILSGLVRAPVGRGTAAAGTFAARLAQAPEAKREALCGELVRAEVAAVLGHGSPDAIDPDRAFKDLGFDSLAAVELRNRLSVMTGLRLAPTVVFDHPNSAALGGYLLEKIGQGPAVGVDAELAQLERVLTAIPADDPGRLKLAAHLRALAGDLEGTGHSRSRSSSSADRLEAASDEELLDFIDQQVGPGEAS